MDMHGLFRLLPVAALLAAACGNPPAQPFEPAPDARVIPFRGNVFVTQAAGSFYEEAAGTIDTYEGTI